MSGEGHPESAGLTGFTAAYLVQQMADFKSGARKDSARMNAIAKDVTDEESVQVAAWFAALKPGQWTKVTEGDAVPKTIVGQGRMRFLAPAGGTEPIGNRIIEMPENTEATEILRNPRSGFIAYVPTGSLKKGLQLVMSGVNGKTTQCTVCHGDELKGIGPVPGIAGKSPSYLVRQLWDMKTGMRRGAWIDLMKPVADKLTEEEMLNIAAYASSRPPQ
jgi:cytochrome c553